MSEFFQEAPQLGNQYADDRVLRSWLEWRLPADLHAALEPGRRLSFALARCYAAVLLIEIASARAHQADAREHVETALRWCAQDLAPLPDPSRAGAPGIAAGRV